ncbi:MAG: hypothetical protein ABSF03_27985 [Streptosporangiaceae bacterium]
MTAPAENTAMGPADSLEVRWIVPGRLPEAMRAWFARFPAGTETREDIYLLRPRLRGLSVKLRDGSSLDVKSFRGSPGILGLPHRGRLESWRKWSFPYDLPGEDDDVLPGWVTVGKTRRSSWFPLASQDPPQAARPAGQTGCQAELTEAHARGEPWWSVGFEAAGSSGLLRDALQHAADLVFAQPLPTGAGLSLDNCRSYAQWLSQPPGPGAGDTARSQ